MKFLHTADWHVGKTLKGRDRLDEHTRVLADIRSAATENAVDAVIVAGDLYDHAVPRPAAVALVVQTLMALAAEGIEVIVIAGNHDHAGSFEAYRPLMQLARINIFGGFRPAAEGGVHRFAARSTGEPVNVAVMPFLSQRYAVQAWHILNQTPAQNVGSYEALVREVIDNLATGFTDDGVNIMTAHLTCTGAAFGGGERAAQSIFEYHVPAAAFPHDAHYVALGHLHRRQPVPAACPVHYSGAPLAVDFGEQDNASVVCLIEASPGTPARVSDIPITAGRRLRTVDGSVEELIAAAETFGDDFLRLVVTQPSYAGMRDHLLEALPNALEIRIHSDHAATSGYDGLTVARPTRTPSELFAEYCSSAGLSDSRVQQLFDRLYDEASGAQVEVA